MQSEIGEEILHGMTENTKFQYSHLINYLLTSLVWSVLVKHRTPVFART